MWKLNERYVNNIEYEDIFHGNIKKKVEIARHYIENLKTGEKLRQRKEWLEKTNKKELNSFYQVTPFIYVCTIKSVIVKWKYIINIIRAQCVGGGA